MKNYLLTMLGLLISFQLVARDFSYTYEGNTLIYTVFDENAKTCGINYENNSVNNKVSGKLIIPEIAIDGDSQYSVVRIEYYSLHDCKGITSVTIPKSVTEISYNPFAFSTSLAEINVDPDNPSFASFKGALFNKELTELIAVGGGKKGKFVIPNSVIRIGTIALGGCIRLESVRIPNSVKTIGMQAFGFCHGLTSVTIPASVSEIESGVFSYCKSLTEINVDSENLNYASFEGALYDKNKTYLITVGYGRKGKFVVPPSVRKIGDCAFLCPYLTSVTIPGSVMEIDRASFQDCFSLTDIYVAPDNPNYASYEGALYSKDESVLIRVGGGKQGLFVIPYPVVTIGYSSFEDCQNLTSVYISGSVKNIEKFAFYGLASFYIKKVYCAAEIPPTCAEYAFHEEIFEGTLYVPVGAKSVYEQVDPWQNFKNIVESDFAGIDAIAASEKSISIKVENGRICVMNKPADNAVKVYNLQGQIVSQTCSDEVDGLPSGIYIVAVGTRSFKVIL